MPHQGTRQGSVYEVRENLYSRVALNSMDTNDSHFEIN